jgi:hypothetical protein
MYEEVYKEMANVGIASQVDTKVIVDKNGSIVEHKDKGYGLPTKYLMQCPDKLLFVDEVGSNTSTTKDGNLLGGEKFLCERLGRPQIRAATKDSHFTVLGFTAATGAPVMCAVFFSSKELCEEWIVGYNGSAPWLGDDDDVDANTGGLHKQFPMGPVCTYNGVDVPTFCCCSENGSITADLLVKMLQVIDTLQVFDRSDGEAPFLLLDGHGSCFDLQFLEYINSACTNWTVCIRVPYGTSYWQVGDSREQNGCFKMALTRYKRQLLKEKEIVGAEFAIEKEDVINLVAQAWADSFARVAHNQNAIADRGWSLLTYNCLLHPEILATRSKDREVHESGNNNNDEQEDSGPLDHELKFSQGLSGKLMDSILETRIREDTRNGVNLEDKRRKRVQTVVDAINSKKKRYTAGLHASAGQFALGPDVLRNIQERRQQQDDKVSEQQERRLRAFESLQNKL